MAPALILDRDLDLEVIRPGLLDLAAQSLGNAATPEDGHDALFAEAVGAFTLGAAQVAELEPLLNQHFAGAMEATSDTLAGETALLAANLETGRQILKEGGVNIAVDVPGQIPSGAGPTPPPAVP